jgi:glutamine amidotransferase
MIGIVNYHMGNLGSVKKKLEQLGQDVLVSENPSELALADKLILPGVGHFARAVQELKSLQLWDFLSDQALIKKKPILGICLGMQLMAKFSEEGNAEGLGWFDATVVHFHVPDPIRYKVPHIGWNSLEYEHPHPLLTGLQPDDAFYFVHAYHLENVVESDVLCSTDYGYRFVSGIKKGNIMGVQFHPEKSHAAGTQMLANFVNGSF